MGKRIARSTANLLALFFACAVPAAMAHSGHDHSSDGRIPGQPDFERIGKVEVQFHPQARAYTYKRSPNTPPLWFHIDDVAAATRSGEAFLTTSQEPIVCTGAGHRIRIMYSSKDSYTPSPAKVEQIRTIVRRMASKILSQSMVSSANTKGLRMAVECDASGDIRIQAFKSNGDWQEVFGIVDGIFGNPTGANAVKTLVFYDGADPDKAASGYGQSYEDPDKTSSDEVSFFGGGGNFNRVLSAVGVVYHEGWEYHTPLHELFHTLGAVQDEAPYSTTGFHCWDGIDVMCYDDDTFLGGLYYEDHCPGSENYHKTEKIPLDCQYDTYFDAAEESGEYLNSNWNVGGSENPFLIQAPAGASPSIEATSVSGLTKTSATLGATVKPNGLSTQYRFEYGLTAPAYGSKVPIPDGTLDSNLYQSQPISHVAALLPGTTYHYRLVATNAKGTSPSSDQTFTTPVSWNTQATPNASGAKHSNLYDMSCEPASFGTCVAVGKQTASDGTSSPYAQLWNNGFWTNQSTAVPAGATAAELQADHCLSKTSCVAAGSYTTSSGTFSLVEAWNGSSWSIQTTPNPAGATATRLKGISCNAITACIAVGYKGSGSSSQPVAIRGSSGTWSLETVPLPSGAVGAELTGVECTSTTSCVAVGRYYPTASTTTYWGMVSTWNGTSWSSEAVPKPTGEPKRSSLLDISCVSVSNCTAVGAYMNSSSTQVSYVERWSGSSWSWQSSPNPAGATNTVFQNVSCVESSPCVAVGDWLDSSGVWRPMAQFWNGASWVIEPVDVPAGTTFGVFEGVACRSRCITAGWYTSGAIDKTLAEMR